MDTTQPVDIDIDDFRQWVTSFMNERLRYIDNTLNVKETIIEKVIDAVQSDNLCLYGSFVTAYVFEQIISAPSKSFFANGLKRPDDIDIGFIGDAAGFVTYVQSFENASSIEHDYTSYGTNRKSFTVANVKYNHPTQRDYCGMRGDNNITLQPCFIMSSPTNDDGTPSDTTNDESQIRTELDCFNFALDHASFAYGSMFIYQGKLYNMTEQAVTELTTAVITSYKVPQMMAYAEKQFLKTIKRGFIIPVKFVRGHGFNFYGTYNVLNFNSDDGTIDIKSRSGIHAGTKCTLKARPLYTKGEYRMRRFEMTVCDTSLDQYVAMISDDYIRGEPVILLKIDGESIEPEIDFKKKVIVHNVATNDNYHYKVITDDITQINIGDNLMVEYRSGKLYNVDQKYINYTFPHEIYRSKKKLVAATASDFLQCMEAHCQANP